LDGEGKTVDELAQLSGGDVQVSVEGCKDGTRGQQGDVSDRGSSRQRRDGIGDSADMLTE